MTNPNRDITVTVLACDQDKVVFAKADGTEFVLPWGEAYEQWNLHGNIDEDSPADALRFDQALEDGEYHTAVGCVIELPTLGIEHYL